MSRVTFFAHGEIPFIIQGLLRDLVPGDVLKRTPKECTLFAEVYFRVRMRPRGRKYGGRDACADLLYEYVWVFN